MELLSRIELTSNPSVNEMFKRSLLDLQFRLEAWQHSVMEQLMLEGITEFSRLSSHKKQ